MAASGKSNELETREGREDYFVAFLARSLLRSENNDAAIVLVTTLIIVATISIVIRTLKSHRRANFSTLSKKHKKRLNSGIVRNGKTGRIDKLSIDEGFDAASVPSRESVNYKSLLSELHFSANKCYIKKHGERCAELVNYCPPLINAKCGSTGLTPFHRVCLNGNAALITIMLSKGADPHSTFDGGANAICLAVLHYLNKRENVDRSDMRCLDILQQAGCKLDGNSNWYNMLLKKAVQSGKTALIEWLITNSIIPKANSLERNSSLSLVY